VGPEKRRPATPVAMVSRRLRAPPAPPAALH